jgi:signal transduction histidine kinase
MQISTKNIIILVVLVSLILLMVGFFIFSYVRLYNQKKKIMAEEKKILNDEFEKQLLRSQIEVQETTFTTLGRELHDNIGQMLSTTKMLLGISEKDLSSLPHTYITAKETLSKAILELRSISKSLDKEWLEQFNFIENVQNEVKRINSSEELQVHFLCECETFLSAEKQVILFRIVQEAIQNSVKHSSARNLLIQMKINDTLVVIVADDGIGMTGEGNYKGMGLFNMKQRASLLGGSIVWNTPESGGTSILINVPIISVS